MVCAWLLTILGKKVKKVMPMDRTPSIHGFTNICKLFYYHKNSLYKNHQPQNIKNSGLDIETENNIRIILKLKSFVKASIRVKC